MAMQEPPAVTTMTADRIARLDYGDAATGDGVMDLDESPDRDGVPEPPDRRK